MDIDIDNLISLVEERPVLWDKTIPEYKDKFLKTDAWKSVCIHLEPNFEELSNEEKTRLGKEVLKKWRGIKDNFSKYEKKLKEMAEAGSGTKKVKQYHLYKQLLFLKKNDILSTTEDDEPKNVNTSDQVNQKGTKRSSSCELPSRKRKPEEFISIVKPSIITEPESRHMSFFKGILPSVEKLNDSQTLIFQSRVLEILTDLQQPAWYPAHHTTVQPGYEMPFPSGSTQSSSTIKHQTLDIEIKEDSLSVSSETNSE